MEVIICGAGILGYNIAKYLILENNNVTVIDTDSALIAKINDELDCRGVVGHASAPYTWEKIGADGADVMIAVTRDDEVNMIACKVAHELFNVPKKIARIREQSYLNPKWRGALFNNKSVPIDLYISPEREVANAIIRRIHAPGATDIVPLNTANVSLVGVVVEDNSPILENAVERVLSSYENLPLNIMAVVEKDGVSPPDLGGVLTAGDEVYFVCQNDKILDALALFGHEDAPARNVIILGGGFVGSYLAEDLSEECKVTIVEHNPMTARKLAERMPRNVVIHGDALQPEVLQDGAIHQKDICIAVTNSDEVNLISSMCAHESGVGSTICLLKTVNYSSVARKGGVDITVHPMEIIGSRILQSIRHGAVKNLYSLQENSAEIVEMEIAKNAQVVGMHLGDVKMPRGTFVGMVIPKQSSADCPTLIVPHDNLILNGQDRVVMLVSPSNINRIVQMFTNDTYI